MNPAYAVRCLQKEDMVIVDDGRARAFKDFFLDETQPSRLLSMVAFPIIKKRDGAVVYRAALVVDTQLAGFFSVKDRANLMTFFRQIEARLNLQDALSELLSSPNGPSNVAPQAEKPKEGPSGPAGPPPPTRKRRGNR